MSSPEPVIGSEPSHGVQFYEDDDVLAASVAHYLGAGLAVGETVLVIATEVHWAAIAGALERNAFDVNGAMKAGRLTFRDARETLARLMVGDMPDRRLFREVLERLLESVGPHVRAYGEMVDLLWKDGNLPAALRLEELWNELREERSLPPSRANAAEARMREIGHLQQRARALEREIGQRKELETALREALEEREKLLAERARLFEEAERVEASQRFLSEASGVLAGSLDYDATLAAVTRLAVPHMADWASIDMVNSDGTFRRVGVAHVDPAKVALGWELWRRHPASSLDPTGPGNVIRTGQPEVFEHITDDFLARAVKDAEILRVLRLLGPVSSLCVPLKVGGRPAGAMTLVSTESRRHFGASDLTLAEELARRASVAIENAQAYWEAKEANRLKDDFLATMSHELRTPLNAILGWSSMLRTRPGVDVKKAVETIERNARTQVRLIEEILDISRIMTGKLRIERRAFDLAAVVRASIDIVSPSAQAKGIALEVSLADETCFFHGDADRLQQVCWNLLSNAIKFTPKGGQVRVRLARKGSDVDFTVEDTGRGIRADFLPYLFLRFRQADSSTTRAEGGLGLGLAIVSHLVELHGGTVSASSTGEGRGASFTVVLPVHAIAAERRSPSNPVPDERLLSGLRVLICEDDVDSRELLHEVLSSEGATVRLAAAAGEAMNHLREFHPDVLVSDIGLPLIDGYALMRQIRELAPAEGGRTPAIALTAFAGAEDARRALSAGYQLHVTKPVDPQELAARVANLAGRSRRAEDTH